MFLESNGCQVTTPDRVTLTRIKNHIEEYYKDLYVRAYNTGLYTTYLLSFDLGTKSVSISVKAGEDVGQVINVILQHDCVMYLYVELYSYLIAGTAVATNE